MTQRPTPSPLASALSDKVFSKLAAKAKERNDVIALSVGDTYREPLEGARSEAQRSAEIPGLHRYAPVLGEKPLREAISQRLLRRFDAEIAAQNIQITPGATAGISIIAQALLSPGDEVLLPSPFWPLVRGILKLRGVIPREIPCMHRDVSADEMHSLLARSLNKKTRALYLNSPHNPTGRILAPEVIKSMLSFAKKHNLWVISDEAYQDLYFDAPPKAVWQYKDASDRTVAAHTLSKSYALAGARIGYIHGPEHAMKAIRAVQTFSTYCAPRPMQFAATHALQEGDTWLEEARKAYLPAAKKVANTFGIETPQGGTFILIDVSAYLPQNAEDAYPFLEAALDRGVLLTPGSACGVDFKKWVRLCFSNVPLNRLEEALTRLAPLLRNSPSDVDE